MGTLVSLDEFHLSKCVKLKENRLAQGKKFGWISMTDWSSLEELPNLETLVYLDYLWEGDCVMLKRKQGLVQDIQCLHVCRCSKLEQMPSMEKMGYLEVLTKEGCVKLKRIHGLMHLKIFNL